MIARMLRFAGAFLLVLSTQLHAVETGAITLAEGGVRLMRGAAVLQASEGVRIQSGDILETDDRGFCVVEFGDGLLIGLGPLTRIYLADGNPRTKQADSGQAIILLAGWLKLQSGKGAPADGYRVLATGLGISSRDANLLAHATDQRMSVFMESGSARLLEPDDAGRTAVGPTLGVGQFVSRGAGQRLALQARPDSGFLVGMPRGFRDALPARPERLKASPKAPKPDHDARYEEVKDWLQLPQAWRVDMVRRFSVRLRDAQFRKAVTANLPRHPEWHAVLYPPRPSEAGRAPLRYRDSRNKEQAQ